MIKPCVDFTFENFASQTACLSSLDSWGSSSVMHTRHSSCKNGNYYSLQVKLNTPRTTTLLPELQFEPSNRRGYDGKACRGKTIKSRTNFSPSTDSSFQVINSQSHFPCSSWGVLTFLVQEQTTLTGSHEQRTWEYQEGMKHELTKIE